MKKVSAVIICRIKRLLNAWIDQPETSKIIFIHYNLLHQYQNQISLHYQTIAQFPF